jgi:NAD(P)-dependent dehydrogenase (short-subunit alcohol dehydrogenase family)
MTATSTKRSVYVRPSSFDYGSADGNRSRRRNHLCARRGTHRCVWPSRQRRTSVGCRATRARSRAIFVRTDVRKDEDVRNLVDQTVKRFGRLDVAVNNAGTEGTPGPVTEQTAETYAATFDTNVLGTLLSMKHELRVMLAQGSGSIVNLSSAYGSVGAAGASVYVASKHAIEGLTKSAALEVAGTGVRVNVVAPGTTDTGMLTRFTSTDENKAALVSTVPVKRMATSEEIAHVIAFVASENASYMTGSSIPVDGGMIAG